ncbi:MAG: TetR/AcrR family transcriptional regulator [Eubacteriaceae bacterium]|nr:TetR/AcrR family transcriptional regulator [Eubacteriaceae bacterium]
MQIQKKEIRDKIIISATEVFAQNGYKGASLREIAKSAGVTAGNIYSYFKSKSALFEAVLKDTLIVASKFIADIPNEGPLTRQSVKNIAESITGFFLTNKSQFIILTLKAQGSKFEGVKEMMTQAISARLFKEYFSPYGYKDELLARAYAHSFFSGIIDIFVNYGEDEERLKGLVDDFTGLMFYTAPIFTPGRAE